MKNLVFAFLILLATLSICPGQCGPLPTGLIQGSIGSATGQTCYVGGTLTYADTANGLGSRATADEFHWTYDTLDSSTDISVRIDNMYAGDSSAQAGLCLREHENPGSPMVALWLHKKRKELTFAYRQTQDGPLIKITNTVALKKRNLYLRLVYNPSNNLVIPYQSRTGTPTSWETINNKVAFFMPNLEEYFGGFYGASGRSAPKPFAFSNFFIDGTQYRLGIDGDGADILVYPNPFKEHISYTAPSGSFVALFDIAGRIVLQPAFSGEGRFDTSSLPCGVYFLSLLLFAK